MRNKKDIQMSIRKKKKKKKKKEISAKNYIGL